MSLSLGSSAQRLELFIELVAATVISRVVSVERVLGECARWMDHVEVTQEDVELEALEAIALSLSAKIPLCNCLDQALALRWFLARRGVRAVVVVGFKWEAGGWQGHAWLEVAQRGRMLWSGADRFKEVTREPVR